MMNTKYFNEYQLFLSLTNFQKFENYTILWLFVNNPNYSVNMLIGSAFSQL